MKKVIICDFTEYNDPHNKLGNYHYANCFVGGGYEVLWVSNPFNELIYFKDKEDYAFKKSISQPVRHMLAKNIYGYAPYSQKLYGNYLFCRNAKRILDGYKYIKPHIEDTLKKMDFDEVDVLWISNPKHYWLTNVVKYNKLVFRIPDDFEHMKAWPYSVVEIENKLIDEADLVCITSDCLAEKVLKRGKKPFKLRNGVDYEHFRVETAAPEEYYGKDNIIVYVGAIKEWFDIDIVIKCAEKLKVDIFLIGNPQIDLSCFKSFGNIHILGPKRYDEIPAYLRHAEVGIIPFKLNELTKAINPIKLYEYCSAGLSVVTTAMKEIECLNAPIYISRNSKEFVGNVERALLGKDFNTDKILEYALNNSWTKRYSSLREFLEGSM